MPFWVVLDHFWVILGHFWATLDHFGSFYDHLGPLWAIWGHILATLGHFGSFLAIYGPFCGIFGQICEKFHFFAGKLGSGSSLLECKPRLLILSSSSNKVLLRQFSGIKSEEQKFSWQMFQELEKSEDWMEN